MHTQIIGLDISEGMLEVGRKKILNKELHKTIDMVVGDSENLPFDDSSFDAITVAFGVRNFENSRSRISRNIESFETWRIFVVLETSVPTKFPFKQGYYLHSNVIITTRWKTFF